MKEIIVKIPNDKLYFFKELIKHLGFELSGEIEISDAHKKIVKERMLKSKNDPDRLLEWDKVKDNFKFD